MNLYHLRYFVTLAHLEHYTKAAEILAITQPSLSHAIASLEKELGVKLFEKEGRNVVLTKCGQAFLTDVERALDMLDSSVNKLQMTGSGEGRIDIVQLRVLSSIIVPGFVKGFLEYRLPFSWLHRHVYRHDPGPERPEIRRCLLFHAGS